ncbi:MAG: riboflavin biosynthesis protein RibD, partial [Bacteroidaceae bacterium]|nr:riboflavin biosynthesis protein RibD [Bacteroidaceae bacterium]
MTKEEQRKMDECYMRRALQLASCGREHAAPNPMVGAVVVCDGRIVGEGFHR